MYVRQLIEILKKADPAAPIRFWVGPDTEVDAVAIYDDDCEDEEAGVLEGADCVNIDLDLMDDEGGAGAPWGDDVKDGKYDDTEFAE